MLATLDALIALARPAFLGLALALGGVAAVDWMVRTRRINPFGRVAQLLRRHVDPLLMPVERRVVRAGGLPANAPLWALLAVVVAGIVVLGALTFVRNQLAFVVSAVYAGPRGVYRLVVSWVFTILQVAIIVRVVMSWIHFRPGAWYARWSYRLTEPILRPIRNLIPLIGMIDISPLVAWFALGILESILLSLS